ncbi:HNH endonuclease signature motif containing protein [Nocardioides dongxiaopingii]|uniref:HNH endonuclease signature motif containing protein n=1 Tax=Nocardioides dongxiaopingii TaxID=2576036 RepID=UPI0010C766FB|nr:HNH endonuclease signature motif containing protein [Nocardioides dongxiaopingii]
MSKHPGDRHDGHPVARFVALLETELAALVDVPTWSLDSATTGDLVPRLAGLVAGVQELEARVVGHAGVLDLPGSIGARSLAAWLARVTRVTGAEASRKARLAGDLAAHEPVRVAMAKGRLHGEQAKVIAAAVGDLDGDHLAWRDKAEAHLLGEAAHHDAHDLKTLGRRILETLDPDKADEHEARLLEAEEARARKKTRFAMWDDGEGLAHGRFTMPSAQASMLRKALTAIAAPKHVRAEHGAGSYDHERPTPERLGQALCEYVERYPADQFPAMGGVNATVVVTMTLESLNGGLAAAHLDTGLALSPTQARRMACEAGIIPAVLGGQGHVLDLGRKRRFHTPAQRLALTLEQRHCQHPTCTTPAAYCHTHHRVPWSKGGTTDTRDAVLLCPFHHHQTHATGDTHPMRT